LPSASEADGRGNNPPGVTDRLKGLKVQFNPPPMCKNGLEQMAKSHKKEMKPIYTAEFATLRKKLPPEDVTD
jgi:hypothetical protein